MNDDALETALALICRIGPDVDSVWRHRKGGVYQVMANAIRESDLVPVVVYRETFPTGMGWTRGFPLTWTRPLTEFRDGRFTMVAPAPKKDGA